MATIIVTIIFAIVIIIMVITIIDNMAADRLSISIMVGYPVIIMRADGAGGWHSRQHWRVPSGTWIWTWVSMIPGLLSLLLLLLLRIPIIERLVSG